MLSRLRHDSFEFSGTGISGRVISLKYRLAGGPDPDITFEEKLELPVALPMPDPTDPVVQHLLDGVHRAFGVSYFKAAIPAHIIAPPVTTEDARFWDTLYTEGLGEFWFRNDLDQRGRVHFPTGNEAVSASAGGTPDERSLVLVGGGKDSAVAREIVRHAGVPADALTVGTSAWQQRSTSAMNLRHLVVRRVIDPKLFDLNRHGALNGHIPISACIAFVSTLVAYIGGYSSVIAANERSANEGNLVQNGISVNHQWSKSLSFEEGFQNWCARRLHGGPDYFSILRPLSELRIAAEFARHSKYFDYFTSCNSNFRHLSPQAEAPRWCGHCPKCVFVQLILAPHLDDKAMLGMLGGDFLSDPRNLPVLEELIGITGLKPFECVGTAEESRAALTRLANTGRLRGHLPGWYSERVAPMIGDSASNWEAAMAVHGPHRIPTTWEQRLHAYLGHS